MENEAYAANIARKVCATATEEGNQRIREQMENALKKHGK